ncbi:MAG: Inosine-5'-monophosphate dehydrogenase [Syntrophus sp. SKADARSKE-3]|nr:Inosine-5'-monophosphate dehydrogenase [Syntrophus sp. SKADARSKE-3]
MVMMKTVKDLLKNKEKEVFSIAPKATVYDALKVMGEKEIGALMVKDDDGKILGIITERDYARKIVLKGKHSKETYVEEIMTPAENMYTVKPETSVEDCMVLITGKRIRHVPVYDNNQYVGLISIGDVVKSIISEQEMLIEHLSNYIAGKY